LVADPSVYKQVRAGYVCRTIGQEKRNGVGYVVGSGEPSERNAFHPGGKLVIVGHVTGGHPFAADDADRNDV
jgi:hypothetical protein